MKTHFNQLEPAEAERLVLLSEECAEVIQIIGKIQRHGYESHHPDTPHITNRMLLASEVGHVKAATYLMVESGDISIHSVNDNFAIKQSAYRAKKYLHHQ